MDCVTYFYVSIYIGFLGGLPGQLPARPKKEMTPASDAGSSEYEYYYESENEEEDSGSAPR